MDSRIRYRDPADGDTTTSPNLTSTDDPGAQIGHCDSVFSSTRLSKKVARFTGMQLLVSSLLESPLRLEAGVQTNTVELS